MTLKEAYGCGSAYLKSRGIGDASLDAWYLLEYLTGKRKSDYYAHGEEPLTFDQERRYQELLEKRGSRIPLQHLTGYQEFMGLAFRVGPDVLIPRQDTETLVEEALKVLKPGMRILDVCTGSGCILLSLLCHCVGTQGVGVDVSAEALKIARANAEALLVPEDGKDQARAEFRKSDMFSEIDRSETFDCIVSNPPYIASKEIAELMEEVRNHEPILALDGGDDGLHFYRILAKEAGCYLKDKGCLLVEMGYDQGAAVSELMEAAGFVEVRVIRDLCGNDRVVSGRKDR